MNNTLAPNQQVEVACLGTGLKLTTCVVIEQITPPPPANPKHLPARGNHYRVRELLKQRPLTIRYSVARSQWEEVKA